VGRRPVLMEQKVSALGADAGAQAHDGADIPLQWNTLRLGDIAKVRYGKARPKSVGHIPVVGSGGVFGTAGKSLVDFETLVIGRKGAAGAVFHAEGPTYPSDTTFYLDWTQEVCVAFIYCEMLRRGLAPDRSVIPSLARTDVENYTLPLPPLPEQRAIAQVLRTVRNAIHARRRELELERERKAALMQHLFTHGTRAELTKVTEIGEMPQSWQVVRLGDVATVGSGGTPDRARTEYWNGDIPWVKTGEVNYNVIMQTEECITQAGLQNSSARFIPAGTLLMAMYGQGVTRGRVAVLGIDATLNQACAAIRTSSDVVTSFLFHYLAYSYERIRNLGHGANQKNLNALLIKSIAIALPGIVEQQKIADVLTACDAKSNTLNDEIELLEELFHALLEELMTGHLSTLPLVDAQAGVPA
jgi:type I restriction enzyme, S subunit